MSNASLRQPHKRRRAVAAGLAAIGLTLTTVPLASAATPDEADARPVIFTTDAELDLARERAKGGIEPFYSAWEQVKDEADVALDATYVPEQSENHEEYFALGIAHAQDVRSLALAYHVTGTEVFADKGREILRLWAEDALASPYPSSGSPHSAGLVIGRVIAAFADGYAMLWDTMPAAEREQVDQWFTKMVEPIEQSRYIWQTADEICSYGECSQWEPPWLDHQYFNNHLGAQNLGLMAIGYATKNDALVEAATDGADNPRDLRTLIDGTILMPGDDLYEQDPTLTEGAPEAAAGEIYDRYRTTSGDGLHYTQIHLRFLTLQADIAANNGDADWFAYVGDNGENLELSFEFYSEFLLTGDPAGRTGYYADSYVDGNLLPLYEIAHRHYPDNAAVAEVLSSLDRVWRDKETFGWSLVLTDGAELSDWS